DAVAVLGVRRVVRFEIGRGGGERRVGGLCGRGDVAGAGALAVGLHVLVEHAGVGVAAGLSGAFEGLPSRDGLPGGDPRVHGAAPGGERLGDGRDAGDGRVPPLGVLAGGEVDVRAQALEDAVGDAQGASPLPGVV